MESLNKIIIKKRKKDLYILYFFILSFIAFFAISIFACIIFSMIFFFTYKRTIKILKNEIKILRETEVFETNCCKFENNSIYKFIILEIDLDTEIKEIFLKPGEYNFEMHKSNKKMGVIKFDLKQNDKLVIYKKNNDLEYNERDDDTNFNYKVEKIDFGF